MLIIPIPIVDVPLLQTSGVEVKINGKATTLTIEGEYLCYDDNRCKILDQHQSGDLMHFSAASHGHEDEPHCIIRPPE